MTRDSQSRSWFIVAPNIQENGIGTLSSIDVKGMSYEDLCIKVVEMWCVHANRSACACLYCKSQEGMEHLHIVCESKTPLKFSTVKNTFGDKVHLEETKGNKQQVNDYIHKKGQFAEKGEVILAQAQQGEVNGCQGARTDLEKAYVMIQNGNTPRDIFKGNVDMIKYKTYIEELYYMYKDEITPYIRDVNVIYCCGESGTGKTYEGYAKQIQEHGEDSVYKVSDYKNGFDRYNGQPILVLDEYRGGLPYHQLLTLLDCYKADVPARYCNKMTLWTTVYIATVLPIERLYKNMVKEEDEVYDSISQLLRRINEFRYHYVIHRADGNKEYHYVKIARTTYIDWIKRNEDTKERMENEAQANAFEYDYRPDKGDTLNFIKKERF